MLTSSTYVFGLFFGVIILGLIVGVFSYFLLRNSVLSKKVTKTCRIVSFSTPQMDDTRNFGTLPTLSGTNVNKQYTGFVPDLSAYVVVELMEDRRGTLKKLHCAPQLLEGLGKVGDLVRITYKGNKLISFTKDV